MNDQEFPFSDPRVKKIIQAAFPGAKSRRPVKISARNSHRVSDYWDGGSRDETRFVRIPDMVVRSSADIPEKYRQKTANPFNLPICDINIPEDILVVIHVIFRGKDLGYRIYYNPVCSLSSGQELVSLPEVSGVKQLTE